MRLTGRTVLLGAAAGLFLVAFIFVAGFLLGNSQSADQSNKEGEANPGPQQLAVGETYTSPANGLHITVLQPRRYDEPPLSKAKNGKTEESNPLLPNLDPTSENVLVFELHISNGGSNPVDVQPQSFNLEDQNGNRFAQIIDTQIVGPADNNFGQFLPGQERVSRASFEAPRDATDLVLTFRPQSALVVGWGAKYLYSTNFLEGKFSETHIQDSE